MCFAVVHGDDPSRKGRSDFLARRQDRFN